jgi:hypothetical protein
MARKASRRVAASKGKKSPAPKGRKSSATKRVGGAKRTARSAPAGQRKTVSVERFVRSVRTLHDLGLVTTFLQSAKRAKLTLTMDAAAFERVKSSVNGQRQAAPVSRGTRNSSLVAARALRAPAPAGVKPLPGKDPFDFGSDAAAQGGLGRVAPLRSRDPWDF